MSFLGVFSKSFGVLASKLVLLVPFLAVAYAVAAFVTPMFADESSAFFFEVFNAPLGYVPFQQLPFYAASQNPEGFTAVVLMTLINLAIGAFFTGVFTAAVKEKSAAKGFSLAVKRLGGLLALTFLVSFIYLLFAALAWALVSLAALTQGVAGLLLGVAAAVVMLSIFIELQVRLFLAYPALMFEKKTAADALGKSNAFGRTRFWKIFGTLAVLYAVIALGSMLDESVSGWLSLQPTELWVDDLVSGLIGAAVAGYSFIVPAVYYSENRLG